MSLIREPDRPAWLPFLRVTVGVRDMPSSWRDYLYWNVELVDA